MGFFKKTPATNHGPAEEDTIAEDFGRRELPFYQPVDMGYLSPDGSYSNMALYTVRGIKPSTGRQNTIGLHAKSEVDAKRLSGFTEPISADLNFPERRTSRQLEFAKELKLFIPPNASVDDASALISRALDEDDESPDLELVLFADEMDLQFSRYIGKNALIARVFYKLNQRAQYAFYCYLVYAFKMKTQVRDIRKEPMRNVFEEYARMVIEDKTLTVSFEANCTPDIVDQNRVKAYKVALEVIGVPK